VVKTHRNSFGDKHMIRSRLARTLHILTLVAAATAWQAEVAAQTPAPSLLTQACYVPESGTLYAVAVPQAPAACQSEHMAAQFGLFLPFTSTTSAASPLLSLTNSGTGGALYASSAGPATAYFDNTAGGNNFTLFATGHGTYPTARFDNTTGSGNALEAFGGVSVVGNLSATSAGWSTAFFNNTAGGNNFALLAVGHGTYPAAQFENRTGLAPALRTFGSADVIGDLSVSGNTSTLGSKSAIVLTSMGMRELYSEEATEIWFADYGFGRLENGEVWVPLDPLFSETVDLGEPYHVFVQPYGDTDLYVSERSAIGFRVKARNGELGSEFSFRVVAKRKGYKTKRLNSAGVTKAAF